MCTIKVSCTSISSSLGHILSVSVVSCGCIWSLNVSSDLRACVSAFCVSCILSLGTWSDFRDCALVAAASCGRFSSFCPNFPALTARVSRGSVSSFATSSDLRRCVLITDVSCGLVSICVSGFRDWSLDTISSDFRECVLAAGASRVASVSSCLRGCVLAKGVSDGCVSCVDISSDFRGFIIAASVLSAGCTFGSSLDLCAPRGGALSFDIS